MKDHATALLYGMISTALVVFYSGCSNSRLPSAPASFNTCGSDAKAKTKESTSTTETRSESKSTKKSENTDSTDFDLQASGLVNYDQDIAPIFAESCLGSACHSESAAMPLVNYAQVKALTKEIVATVVEDRSMPPGTPLESHNRNLILDWQDAGFPENSESAAEIEETNSSNDASATSSGC